ncbi:hypothetical protein PR048_019893 [Dryococelus australis]|uniref:Uncharacterized protein n=1 Tax=Dryococelus australis TaxID=614101 RepID=A0ABQ9H4R6_9NEOP|nr:hypothetical protein PR048_019893 [Dryococelus australis]
MARIEFATYEEDYDGSYTATLPRSVSKRFERCRWSASFPGGLLFPPPMHSVAALSSPRFTLVGSQDSDEKSRLNISTPLFVLWRVWDRRGKKGSPSRAGPEGVTRSSTPLETMRLAAVESCVSPPPPATLLNHPGPVRALVAFVANLRDDSHPEKSRRASAIARRDSHVRKSGGDLAGNRTRSALAEEYSEGRTMSGLEKSWEEPRTDCSLHYACRRRYETTHACTAARLRILTNAQFKHLLVPRTAAAHWPENVGMPSANQCLVTCSPIRGSAIKPLAGMQGRKIPEKTRRPAVSSGTIPNYENLGLSQPGIELDSPW